MSRREAGIWTRLVVRTVAYDLSVAIPVGAIWVAVLDASPAVPFLLVMVLRLAVVLLRLHAEFGPLRGWDRGGALDDQALLAINRSLQAGPRRFTTTYLACWVGALAVAAGVGRLGLFAPMTAPTADAFLATLLVLGTTCAVSPMLVALFDPLLLEARAAVGAELLDRNIEPEREKTTIIDATTLLNVMYVLGVFFAVSSVAGKVTIDAWRNQDLAELQLGVERVATHYGESGELAADLSILDASALPAAMIEGQGELEGEPLGILVPVDGRAMAAAPLGEGRWIYGEAELDSNLGLLIGFVLLSPLLFVVPLMIANLASTRSLARQLTEVQNTTQRVLSAGQIRGIPRFRPPRNDEVGRLIMDFNGLLDVLEELAEAAHAVAQGDLTVSIDRPGDLQDAFQGMLGRLRESVTQIRATAIELAEAAARIRAVASEQERVVEQQSDSVNEVGDTVELLARAAKDVTETATLVLANAEQTLTNTDAMVGKIASLKDHTTSIAELLEVIQEVADRSDLLALNGSLEATRAGDAGRGFALVATEMRRLAERVGGTVADVRVQIADIGSAGTSTVVATELSRKLAERTAAAAREISTVTETQHRDTQHVLDAIGEVADAVAATASATGQTRAAAEGLLHHAAALEQLTGQFELD